MIGPVHTAGASRPLRTCVGCRVVEAQDRLVRMVADRAGRIRLSRSRRDPGRGAYLHPHRDCVERATRKKAIGRALRRNIVEPPGDELWTCIESLELAGRHP